MRTSASVTPSTRQAASHTNVRHTTRRREERVRM